MCSLALLWSGCFYHASSRYYAPTLPDVQSANARVWTGAPHVDRLYSETLILEFESARLEISVENYHERSLAITVLLVPLIPFFPFSLLDRARDPGEFDSLEIWVVVKVIASGRQAVSGIDVPELHLTADNHTYAVARVRPYCHATTEVEPGKLSAAPFEMEAACVVFELPSSPRNEVTIHLGSLTTAEGSFSLPMVTFSRQSRLVSYFLD